MTQMFQTLHIERVLPMTINEAERAFDNWFMNRTLTDGLDAPNVLPLNCGSLLITRYSRTIEGGPIQALVTRRRLRGVIRSPLMLFRVPVEVELTAWSPSRSQLGMRPDLRWPLGDLAIERYFRIGGEAMALLITELMQENSPANSAAM